VSETTISASPIDAKQTAVDLPASEAKAPSVRPTPWDMLFPGRLASVTFGDDALTARIYTLGDMRRSKPMGADTRVPFASHSVREMVRQQGKWVQTAEPPAIPEPAKFSDPRARHARLGEQHGRARLTTEKVLEIRAWADSHYKRRVTPPWEARALELDVSISCLRDIVFRRTWTHI
jgi:hypothetical protein